MAVPHTLTPNAAIQAGGHRVARALDALGVPARGAVAALLPNVPEFLAVYRGCAWSGRRFTALSWRWTADDAAYVVHNCEAEVLVAHARFADVAQRAGAHLPPERRLAVGGPIPGFVPFEDVVGPCDDGPLDVPLAGDVMGYTSGTTGRPKGVLRPLPPDMAPPNRVGRGGMAMLQHYLGDEPDRVHLVAAPLYHAGPVSYCEGASLLGADVVLLDGWEAEEVLRLIERHRVTSTFLVPIHFVRLLRLPEAVRRRYDLSSLRLVVHGSAPTSVEVKRQMIDWLGPIIHEFYGGTEGGGLTVSSTAWLERPGTVGRPYAPDVSVHVLDDEGRPCPPGVEGTVYFRQPGKVVYKDDPDKTAAAHRGELFTLGDIGVLDDDGYLFLRDRRADVVISGGVNIYPAQIESVLLAHPEVADCCAVGEPDEEWGESLVAVVVPVAGASVEGLEERLRDACRETLATYQVPRRFVLEPDLPRTEAGKLARAAVRAPFWAGRERRI
jgi:long-chain acyl-CoA synthetase